MHTKHAMLKALAVAITFFAISDRVAAGGLTMTTGSGTKGAFSFSFDVHRLPGERTEGYFVLVIDKGPLLQPIVCTYGAFANLAVAPYAPNGLIASFDATGRCVGESDFGSGPVAVDFPVTNQFAIVDYGEPGRGVDIVNANGDALAIPGGTIDTGNVQVRAGF